MDKHPIARPSLETYRTGFEQAAAGRAVGIGGDADECERNTDLFQMDRCVTSRM